MPNSTRPWLIWSTVAASSAMRRGWIKGNTCTAMPTLSCLVRAAMALATTIGADRTERFGVKWASPSQAVSNPMISASSTSSKASWKLSSCVPPRRTAKSTLIPKSIYGLLTVTGISQLDSDLTSLDRRLSHSINQAVQVHRRCEGGIALGDLARADRLGKERIQLTHIIRSALGHVLGYIAIARWNVQRLQFAVSTCALKLDRAELRGLICRGDEGALAPVDFETIACASPGKTGDMDRGHRTVGQLPADQDIVGSRDVDQALGIHLQPLRHLGRHYCRHLAKIPHNKAHGIDGVPGGDGQS